jgi:hypothetical protein
MCHYFMHGPSFCLPRIYCKFDLWPLVDRIQFNTKLSLMIAKISYLGLPGFVNFVSQLVELV